MIITIYRNWLALEVETETRKAGFVQIADSANDARLESQKGKEFSDEAYFDRKAEQAISGLTSILHKFIVKVDNTLARKSSADNALKFDATTEQLQRETWSVELTDDPRRNIYSVSLANMMHKYIVYNMLYSWSVSVFPNLSTEYKERMAASEKEIKELVYRKELPTLEED